jgi:hypothetical protein
MFIAILPLLQFFGFSSSLSPLPMVMEVNGRRRKICVGMCVESGTERVKKPVSRDAKCQKRGSWRRSGKCFLDLLLAVYARKLLKQPK